MSDTDEYERRETSVLDSPPEGEGWEVESETGLGSAAVVNWRRRKEGDVEFLARLLWDYFSEQVYQNMRVADAMRLSTLRGRKR